MGQQEWIRKCHATMEMRIGEETRAKVSRIGRTDSLLYSTYLHAFDVLTSVIDSCANGERDRRDRNSLSAGESESETYNSYNNIIPFVAGRGRGKTSAMLTFGKALKGLDELSMQHPREWGERLGDVFCKPVPEELKKAVQRLQGVRFLMMDPIDPSILRREHDILTVFLSQIYEQCSVEDFSKKVSDRMMGR